MSAEEMGQEDLERLLRAGEDASSGTLDQSEVEALLAGKEPSAAPPREAGASARKLELESLVSRGASAAEGTFDLLSDVALNVRIELGRRRMYVEDILRLGEGSVVELDKLAGDPVDVLVNDIPVAKGEVLVLNDYFCVRVTEILSPKERLAGG